MTRYIFIFILLFFPIINIAAQQDAGAKAPAQTTTNDNNNNSYYADPFSDFTELESQDEEEEQEAMERFYSYGRLFHIAFFGEVASATGSMANIYHRGFLMGGRISYFLDWDIAITFNIGVGTLPVSFPNSDTVTRGAYPLFTGSALLFNLGFGIKYYFNFQDISRAIAYINPAFQTGMELSIINDSMDTYNAPSGVPDISHRSVAPGLYAGMSLEMPIFRKRIYLGASFIYHISFFSDTNKKILPTDQYHRNLDYSGNYMTYGGQLIWNM